MKKDKNVKNVKEEISLNHIFGNVMDQVDDLVKNGSRDDYDPEKKYFDGIATWSERHSYDDSDD